MPLNHITNECMRILEPMLHRKPLDVQEVNHLNFDEIQKLYLIFAEKDMLTTKNLNNEILLPACYQLADKLNKIKYYSCVKMPISTEIKQWSTLEHNNLRLTIMKQYSIERSQEEIILQIWVIKK